MYKKLDEQEKTVGISHIIPRSFCLSKQDAKPHGIVLIPKEKDCRIDFYTMESDPNENILAKFAESLKDEPACIMHGKFDEQRKKDLYSVRAKYEIGEREYLEIHFGPHKDFNKRIGLLITTHKPRADINEIIKRKDIRRFIDSFEIID